MQIFIVTFFRIKVTVGALGSSNVQKGKFFRKTGGQFMLAARNYDERLVDEDFRDDQPTGFAGQSAPEEESAASTVKPGRVIVYAALATAVLAGSLFAGRELRRRRLGYDKFHPINPYTAYEEDTGTEYEAIGI
jgi:hypothetical protein